MKRTISELKEAVYHEQLGVEVIPPSMLIGFEWGELQRVKEALQKIQERVVLPKKDGEALKRALDLLSLLE